MSGGFDPISAAAGFGAGDAAGQSKATHAATMAAIEQQRMAGSMAHSDKLHMIEKMVMLKKVSAHVAWLRMGIFATKYEKATVINELKRVDPQNPVAKKAQNNEYANEAFQAIRSDPVQTEQYVKEASIEINKAIQEGYILGFNSQLKIGLEAI